MPDPKNLSGQLETAYKELDVQRSFTISLETRVDKVRTRLLEFDVGRSSNSSKKRWEQKEWTGSPC
jgi:hypothetical protein